MSYELPEDNLPHPESLGEYHEPDHCSDDNICQYLSEEWRKRTHISCGVWTSGNSVSVMWDTEVGTQSKLLLLLHYTWEG